MTMNSAESLGILYNVASSESEDSEQHVEAAEFMREVGLKCIGFNGVCQSSYSSLKEVLTRDRYPELSTVSVLSEKVSQQISCLNYRLNQLGKLVTISFSHRDGCGLQERNETNGKIKGNQQERTSKI